MIKTPNEMTLAELKMRYMLRYPDNPDFKTEQFLDAKWTPQQMIDMGYLVEIGELTPSARAERRSPPVTVTIAPTWQLSAEQVADLAAGKSVTVNGHTLTSSGPVSDDDAVIPVTATPHVMPTWTDAEMRLLRGEWSGKPLSLLSLATLRKHWGDDKYQAMANVIEQDFNTDGMHPSSESIAIMNGLHDAALNALRQAPTNLPYTDEVMKSMFERATIGPVVDGPTTVANMYFYSADNERALTIAANKGDGHHLMHLMKTLGRPTFDHLVKELTLAQQMRIVKAVHEVATRPDPVPRWAGRILALFSLAGLLAALLHMWGVV